MMDEESGVVSRIGHLAGDTPSAGAIGSTGDAGCAFSIGRILGKRLRAAGVNLNLAPVLDCLSRPAGALVGNRCFSGDPKEVAAFGRAYIEGMHASGMMTCGKHFPGHGDTDVDSHFALPTVHKPYEAFRNTELVSFREAIAAGTDAIMSAHVVYPAIDPDGLPATISCRILRGLLRGELGFGGLIISDGMEMRAMLDIFPIDEGVFRTLSAGADIALVCHEPAQAAAACLRMEKGIADREISPESLESHDWRIRQMKQKLPAAPGPESDFFCAEDQDEAERIMARAVSVLPPHTADNLPPTGPESFFAALSSRRASPASDSARLNAAAFCAERFGSGYVCTDPAQFPENRQFRKFSSAVFFLEKGESLSVMKAEAERMAAEGVPVIAAALDTPHLLKDMSEGIIRIAAWQYQSLALNQVIRLLGGKPRQR